MNYSVTFHATGSAAIVGLPEVAFVALIQALVRVGDDPFEHSSAGQRSDPNYREIEFGDFGIAAFYVDRPRRAVMVYEVVWAA
ncbi:hypothetical protein SAMN05421505_1559 [Sinosporangium album]|uniref:Uncharacterized protein n=1 Tax=Sinosporangium album TaxID=504805 RepID=A0A1G8KTW2_9ACTN|nr:hypothetical protein [Sinosporangium album]SDI46878.1 hypothetical protein SAMN05421505_1559 [Sinosporangium album]